RCVRVDDGRESRWRAPELLEREAISEVAGTDAAVLLWERKPEEAELTHFLEDVARDLVRLFDLLLEWLKARLHEVARRARKELELLRDVEVHALRLPHVDRHPGGAPAPCAHGARLRGDAP